MVKKTAKKTKEYDVAVIGGGPAGLISAISASGSGAKVILLEKNDEFGKKLLITGGGRCNITNADPDHRNFVSKYGKKGNFLFSPFSVFGVKETIAFFEKLGLKTKVEPGFRVFPESDNSTDVLNVLIEKAKSNGVIFKTGAEVKEIKVNKRTKEVSGVLLVNKEEIIAKNYILATGGASHPETGSTGDGFKWLKDIGHKVAKSNPALVPIKIKGSYINEFAGITLEDVGVSVLQDGKKVINKRGRVLFTHTGLSGPMILNMSKTISDMLSYGEVKVAIDFFPGVGLDVLHQKYLKVFEDNKNKKLKNVVFSEIPEKIFAKLIEIVGMDGDWEINTVRKEERNMLLEKTKKWELKVEGLLGFDKAIITSGGLDLSEVDFKTMKSKIFNNLFFAGDILDFDRPSGGFSLQLCWTTGYIAGKSSV